MPNSIFLRPILRIIMLFVVLINATLNQFSQYSQQRFSISGNFNFGNVLYGPQFNYLSNLKFSDSKVAIYGNNYVARIISPPILNIQVSVPSYYKWWAIILNIFLLLILSWIFTILRGRKLKRANMILEERIRQRTSEIVEQKEVIMAQKNEIIDSIDYASRIQQSAIPSDIYLEKIMPEYFVLFKPKDIVSGDFYWVKEVKNYLIITAADCTGHGVPGAFMSMLGITLLNEQISRSRFDTPGEILTRLRNKVKYALNQSVKSQKVVDGMDMALITIDRETKELQFAGAYNSLYLIRKKSKSIKDVLASYNVSADNMDYQLYDFKGNRQPVGRFPIETEFTNHRIQLQENDTIYLFSDGYTSQFGGPSGKKFALKQFKDLLLNIQNLSMSEQRVKLKVIHEEWKEGIEQVDDILIIGLRI